MTAGSDGANGTKGGFDAWATIKSDSRNGPLRMRRMRSSDEAAIACARIARAFQSELSAAMASLHLHYAARISGLLLTKRGDLGTAIAALQQERDAAIARLQDTIRQRKANAMQAARRAMRRRFRVAAPCVLAGQSGPLRPGRLRPTATIQSSP
jgi:hypothetical protein